MFLKSFFNGTDSKPFFYLENISNTLLTHEIHQRKPTTITQCNQEDEVIGTNSWVNREKLHLKRGVGEGENCRLKRRSGKKNGVRP